MLTKNEPVRFEELHTLMKTEEDLLKSAADNSKNLPIWLWLPTKALPPISTTLPLLSSIPNSMLTEEEVEDVTSIEDEMVDDFKITTVAEGRHPLAKLTAMATAALINPNQTTWISDTRATDHFTPDLNKIPDNKAYTDSQLVSIGNGHQLPISHIDLLTGKPLYKGFSKDGLYPIHGLSLPSLESRLSSLPSRSSATSPFQESSMPCIQLAFHLLDIMPHSLIFGICALDTLKVV
uniref:Uncharacterized protein n=1 Tax=Fagus sylvatica TaxID=28930 RepID=A0A2N9GA69_FAGSY